MHLRFLLGPAGSGKTHRCLAEIGEELRRNPAGPPLLLLAPKQSTFLLERRLLDDPELAGWSRLQVLSFERFARQLVSQGAPTECLDEQGRIMVLRALLRWHQPRLRIFRASARLAGFAQELSGTLRELQRLRLGPDRLETLAAEARGGGGGLGDKLHDLALLLRAYRDWLRDRDLKDADELPDLAAEALKAGDGGGNLGGIWLDGFAELTPQEAHLLAALVPRSSRTTVALCLDQEYREEPSWLSTWSVPARTFRRCLAELSAVPGVEVEVEVLARRPGHGRFANRPGLAYLEDSWTRPTPAAAAADGLDDPCGSDAAASLRLVACRDFEREAEVAAREIWRQVRGGRRFRDLAVIVRTLETGFDVLRRVFLRYEIPFFLDRRETLAHHPLSELTRSALRLAMGDWAHEDWFGALKTGLIPGVGDHVDALENEALANGWTGEFWSRVGDERPAGWTDRRRAVAEAVIPFREFVAALGPEPDGRTLAESLRRLWQRLDIESTLERWSAGLAGDGLELQRQARVHDAAWEQIDGWLDALAQGFGTTRLPLPEWLPVVETGLSTLTAGVIPPSLDQVMIGAIDRSRQPELEVAIVLGLNEGVFPAPSSDSGILTEGDRDWLGAQGVPLESDRRRRVGRERYLAYIACTRARSRLVLTWSERDDDGRPLAPSPFVGLVRALFPRAAVESDAADRVSPDDAVERLAERFQHGSELLPWLLARSGPTSLDGLAGDPRRRTWLRQIRRPATAESLPAPLVDALFGIEPEVSVSALEALASCPFQFFVRQGLRGRERDRFEVDRRRSGSLAHELLARFHRSLADTGRRWRDLDPDAAREHLDRVLEDFLATPDAAVFQATAEARWETETLLETLRGAVEAMVGWMNQYRLDPVLAEVAFGSGASIPAWRVELSGDRALRVRGQADRLDVARPDSGPPGFAVIDYKLRPRLVNDRRLLAGIELQLAAYALALAEALPWREITGTDRAVPVGFFYVGLGGTPKRAPTRSDLPDSTALHSERHRHRGRMRADWVGEFDDRGGGEASGQFLLRFKKDGAPYQGGDARPAEEFERMLGEVRRAVEALGRRLLSGDVSVAPYRLGRATACDACDLRAVCRFDAALQSYRRPVPG